MYMHGDSDFNIHDHFYQQGWQCPICLRVYSPSTPMCFYCGNEKTEYSAGTTDELLINKAQEVKNG